MGIFIAHQPYKVAIYAFSPDVAELSYWEERLSCLVSGLDTTVYQPFRGSEPPNLGTWESMTNWLHHFQATLSRGGIPHQNSGGFKGEGTTILYAISRVTCKVKRNPWDRVFSGSAGLDILIAGMARCWRGKSWKET